MGLDAGLRMGLSPGDKDGDSEMQEAWQSRKGSIDRGQYISTGEAPVRVQYWRCSGFDIRLLGKLH